MQVGRQAGASVGVPGGALRRAGGAGGARKPVFGTLSWLNLSQCPAGLRVRLPRGVHACAAPLGAGSG
jgi:hypothetical protein